MEDSLTRLGTDRLDFYFVHNFDERTPIEEIVRTLDHLARAANLGVISYSPLGGGLLTGKYGTAKRPEAGRLIESQMYIDRYALDSDYATADAFTAFAAQAGIRPATLAVAWAMAHPAVTAPIIGARNLSQLADSLAALDVAMTPGLRAEISALSVTPVPATDRAETLKGS
ncbi:MAG: aldo/keto reductase [Trebonia sp.]